jgi:hypothetical protein
MYIIRYEYNRYIEEIFENSAISGNKIDLLAFRIDFRTINSLRQFYGNSIADIHSVINVLDTLKSDSIIDFYDKKYSIVKNKICKYDVLDSTNFRVVSAKLPLTWLDYFRFKKLNSTIAFIDCPLYNIIEDNT